MKLNKYLLSGGLATLLVFHGVAFAQEDDDDNNEEVEEVEDEELEEDEDVESDDESEEDTSLDEDDEPDEEDADDDTEEVEDETDLDDDESSEDELIEEEVSLIEQYRDELMNYLRYEYSSDVEIVGTVDSLDFEHQTSNVTSKVHGYEIYKLEDESNLRDHDPRMFVLFDLEVINDEDVTIEYRNPLMFRFDGLNDFVYPASEYDMPDNMKHSYMLETDANEYEPGTSRVPVLVRLNSERTDFYENEDVDLLINGTYSFAETVPGEEGRRSGQVSRPHQLVQDNESIEVIDTYWDDISRNRFADKELIRQIDHDYRLETGYVDLAVTGLELSRLVNVDYDEDRNPVDGDNYAAITIELTLTNNTGSSVSNSVLRTTLNIDGQTSTNDIYTFNSFNVYPGHGEVFYQTYLVPANQVESYESIELVIDSLRDGHNNDLVERGEYTFELLD